MLEDVPFLAYSPGEKTDHESFSCESEAKEVTDRSPCSDENGKGSLSHIALVQIVEMSSDKIA